MSLDRLVGFHVNPSGMVGDEITVNGDRFVRAALPIQWHDARKAFIDLPPNSPDAREKLNDLSEAEDALYKALS